MDYEKKYKEALERARKELSVSHTNSDSERQLYRLFPELKESEDEFTIPFGAKDSELIEETYFIPEGMEAVIEGNKIVIKKKESEDEKIRKALIFYLGNMPEDTELRNGVTNRDVLVWLEKQGEEKYLSEPIKDYQGSFTCWNNAQDFRPRHLQRCICYDKYMGGVYCYVYDDISKYWCTQTTEEHDPEGDNHISDYADYRVTMWMPLPDISFYPSKSWIEKQGEIDNYPLECSANTVMTDSKKNQVKPKFKVGD